MLNSRPKNVSNAQIELHQRLLPLTSWQLEKYAAAIDPNFEVIDPNSAVFFDNWVDDSGEKHQGCRQRDTRKRHGIRRFVTSDGRINEGTSKDGMAHGLLREITKSKVTYCLCRDGTYLSQVGFDKDMVQIWKVDPQNLLAEIVPEKICRKQPDLFKR